MMPRFEGTKVGRCCGRDYRTEGGPQYAGGKNGNDMIHDVKGS